MPATVRRPRWPAHAFAFAVPLVYLAMVAAAVPLGVAELLAAIHTTVQPARASLWLRGYGT